MKNVVVKFGLVLMICFVSSTISGCENSQVSVYDYADMQARQMDELLKNQQYTISANSAPLSMASFSEWTYNTLIYMSNTLKPIGVWVFLGSEFFGILLLALVKNELKIRKIAIFLFMLIIPVLAISLPTLLGIFANFCKFF